MPDKEDPFCIPCFIIFCVTAAAIAILVRCIKAMCERNRSVAHHYPPQIVVKAELVDLDDGGNRIAMNPDGEMMAAVTSPTRS